MPELTVVVPVAEPLLDRMAGHLDDVAGQIPEIVELPDWIDPSLLRSAVVAAIVISLVLLVVAARLIRRLVVRMMVVLVLAALAAGLWSQRMELADCAVECSCALFGQAVLVPVDVNPNC
jgi:small-conductance mechanosensitive channel